MRLSFEVTRQDPDTHARRGTLFTRRGRLETPVFMPVGTAGTVKAVDPQEVLALGFQLILGNTYHLMLRPGTEVVAAHGDLHDFMGWGHSILTDSGGYQVFSLAKLRKLDEEGATFRSHIDGSLHLLGPERSIEIQEILGADIMMVFDECPPVDASLEKLRQVCDRTTRWARRCLEARTERGGALFGIVQGGLDVPLRMAHLAELGALPFDGLALGGLALGEGPARTDELVSAVAPHLPPAWPHYLMGVGLPQDIIRAVGSGIDMFDCVVPTRNARNGQLFTWDGPIQIRHAAHIKDTRPVEEGCRCPACSRFSRAYLRHLYQSSEILGSRLNTLHNLYFYAEMMTRIRAAIDEGRYASWARETLERLERPAVAK